MTPTAKTIMVFGKMRPVKVDDVEPRCCSMCHNEFQPESRYVFVCGKCKQTEAWKSGGGVRARMR